MGLAREPLAADVAVELLGDFEGHPSLAKLVAQGYQVITF